MTVFGSDNFNIGSHGTDIVGQNPTVGGVWTDGSDTGAPSPIYDNNRARQTDAATSFTYIATVPPSADYPVQANITPQSGGSGGVAGVFVRKVAGTGAGNLTCYWADYYDHATAGSRQWRLVKYLAGVATVLGTYTENIGTTMKVLLLDAVGTSLKVYVDGVERISATDSAITAAGRAGIIFGAATTPGSNAVYLDNFYAGSIDVQNVALDVATETDEALDVSLTTDVSITLDVATETDDGGDVSIQSISGSSVGAQGGLVFLFTGQPPTQSVTLDVATETDEGIDFSVSVAVDQSITLDVATETDEGVSLTIVGGDPSIGSVAKWRIQGRGRHRRLRQVGP